MTQEGLAEAAELHATFVSNLERGYRVPSLPTVLRVAAGLGVTKPFSLEEVLARVRAVLLRRERGRTADPAASVLRYGDSGTR